MDKDIQLSNLFVLMIFDGLHLLIPQEDVQSVEIIGDVHITPMPSGAIGWFSHGHGDEASIFCLSSDLSFLPDNREGREFLVLLKSEENQLGIACDEVETINIKKEHLFIQPLYKVMKTPTSPINSLVIYKDTIACVCTGVALWRYILEQSELYEQSIINVEANDESLEDDYQ